jgi:hypothetical protein
LQKAVVQHLKLTGVPGLIYFSVPNEGKRTAMMAGHLKAMGMLPGVSDLVMVHDGRIYFLELKAKGEKPTELQLMFGTSAMAAGAQFAWADNIDQAITVLRDWQLIKSMRKAA